MVSNVQMDHTVYTYKDILIIIIFIEKTNAYLLSDIVHNFIQLPTKHSFIRKIKFFNI